MSGPPGAGRLRLTFALPLLRIKMTRVQGRGYGFVFALGER